MVFAQTTGMLAILAVCSLCPGVFFIRKLRWSPLEKLCGAIGLSLVIIYLIYLASFGIYVLKLPAWSHWVVSGVCCLLGLLGLRDLFRMLSARQVRRPLAGFAFLLLWTLLLLGLVRHYSGGGWSGDWYEHYHRTSFFLDKLPVDTVMHGGYLVPARPPMMNILAVHFLAQLTPGFELFQVTFVFLNLLVFFPCCLIARALVKRGPRGILVLICLFALSPMFVENVTYTWTKGVLRDSWDLVISGRLAEEGFPADGCSVRLAGERGAGPLWCRAFHSPCCFALRHPRPC